MSPKKGVFIAKKKNGTIYYRSSITYKNKHISLGSYETEDLAHRAYLNAYDILFLKKHTYEHYPIDSTLSFEKWIVLHNFRDNGYYIKNPIYLHKYYFFYYVDSLQILEMDVDELFFFSTHKIMKRNNYLFINNYGTQSSILQRFGIKSFAVLGKDYYFKDGNPNNLRYHNIVIINPYTGVTKHHSKSKVLYDAKIHIHGNFIIGRYSTLEKAAIAYNKAADYVGFHKISPKTFPRNYIDGINMDAYNKIYQSIKLPRKITSLKQGSQLK